MKRTLEVLAHHRVEHTLTVDLFVHVKAKRTLAHRPHLVPNRLVLDLVMHKGVNVQQRCQELYAHSDFTLAHEGQQEVNALLV